MERYLFEQGQKLGKQEPGQVQVDALVRCSVVFGHVEVRSWIEYDQGRFVGMGSATHYDREGKIIAHNVRPTGVVAYFE